MADFVGKEPFAIQATAEQRREVVIPVDHVRLHGEVILPRTVRGLVLFAHGSGSSRFSPRNQYVAYELNKAELGTCLFDLLSLEEEEEDLTSRRYRFDIGLLAQRLVAVTDWLEQNLALAEPNLRLPIGYFGASTGAAAALIAAAQRPELVRAVVSRGGRPDLASQALARVQAPTLLLVGEWDETVIELNRQAYNQLPASVDKELVIIPGASHLFEEPGRLEQVAQYSAQWFDRYFRR